MSQKIADRAERIAQILLDIHSRWKRPLHVPPHRLCQGLLQECGITVAKLHLDLGAVDYLVPAKQRLCGSRSKACRQHVEHSTSPITPSSSVQWLPGARCHRFNCRPTPPPCHKARCHRDRRAIQESPLQGHHKPNSSAIPAEAKIREPLRRRTG